MNALIQHKLYELAHELDRVRDFTPMVPPQVNINGTSAEELVDQQRAVLTYIDLLMEAMAKAMPHARDWQFEGGEKLAGICRSAWLQRRIWMETFRKEVEAYAVSILEQPAAARKRMPAMPDQFTFDPVMAEVAEAVTKGVATLDEAELHAQVEEELKQVEKTDG